VNGWEVTVTDIRSLTDLYNYLSETPWDISANCLCGEKAKIK